MVTAKKTLKSTEISFYLTNFTVREALDKQLRIKISDNNFDDVSMTHSPFSNFQILKVRFLCILYYYT